MSTSENFLKKHLLSKVDKVLVRGVEEGQEYLVSPAMFYVGPTKDKDTPVEAVKGYNGISGLTLSAVRPENCVFKEVLLDTVKFNKLRHRYFVPVDNVLVDVDDETNSIELNFSRAPIRRYSFPVVAPEELPLDCRVYIGQYKNGTPVLRLVKNSAQLIMLFSTRTHPEKMTFNYHGMAITPWRWSDSKCAYYSLKKEETMAKLTIPTLSSVMDKSTSTENTAPVVDDLQTEADAVAILEELANEPPKEVTKKEPVEEAEVVEDAPVEEKHEEAPSESTAKPKRKMKSKGSLMDLTAVIEACGAAIPDDVTPEDALKEIRQLRDLIKFAVCRLTNLSVAVIEKNGKAAALLDSLRNTLGAK